MRLVLRDARGKERAHSHDASESENEEAAKNKTNKKNNLIT